MLFEATRTHPANRCPILNLEGKAMVKQLFSEENVKKSGIKIVAAYMRCPINTVADHKGFFAIESENPDAITKFFAQLPYM